MTKKLLLLIIGLMPLTILVQAQDNLDEYIEEESVVGTDIKNTAFNIGVLMGGGSLIGVDFEFVIPQTQLGLQVGAGISSIGAGINYHFKKTAASSFVSLQYWQQGFGNNFYASYIGPMFVYRYNRLFQAGIGLASVIQTGPAWDRYYANRETPPSFALLYNIGIYF